MTDPANSPSRNIQQQAAHWLARRHSGRWTMQDKAGLERWLAADLRHRRAYGQLALMWNDLDGVKNDISDLTNAARHYRPKSKPVRRRAVALGLAASLLLAAGTAYWYWLGIETRYLTAKGERQDITLADGSRLRLNTDTELTVRISGTRRSVELQRGEALFTIAPDAARPFIVHAGAGWIRDIGTCFDIYARPEQVGVNVLEGRVQISDHDNGPPLAELSAGGAAAYDAQGALIAAYRSDVQTATAWLDGALVFNDLPLPQVIAELSRYHPVSFELADRRLARIKISGSFQANNLALLLKTLQASFPIKITQTDSRRIRIQAR